MRCRLDFACTSRTHPRACDGKGRPSWAGVIDWDSAPPSNRAWHLSYAAHQSVPLHPTAGLPAWGWDDERARAARLRLLTSSYGLGRAPAEIIDLLVVRLAAMAAYTEQQVQAGDPDFAVNGEENRGAGIANRCATYSTTERHCCREAVRRARRERK